MRVILALGQHGTIESWRHMVQSRTSSVLGTQALPPRRDPYRASEFLSELGDRVRQMRSLCGMSRRELARQSGISERYVAQIEAGKGNVSIVLLLRIAYAIRSAQGDEDHAA
jgi:DNA-binding XRE family transcriptional regulator